MIGVLCDFYGIVYIFAYFLYLYLFHNIFVYPDTKLWRCGSVDAAGTVPGPGESVVYPGPETLEAQRAGLEKAKATLEKYPAQKES